jgi:hypothetical protein
MPLRRGPGKPTVSGNDIDFSMVSDTGAVVRCMITQGAIDNLAGSGASKPIARGRRFWQVEFPGGVWTDCRPDCAETLGKAAFKE